MTRTEGGLGVWDFKRGSLSGERARAGVWAGGGTGAGSRFMAVAVRGVGGFGGGCMGSCCARTGVAWTLVDPALFTAIGPAGVPVPPPSASCASSSAR